MPSAGHFPYHCGFHLPAWLFCGKQSRKRNGKENEKFSIWTFTYHFRSSVLLAYVERLKTGCRLFLVFAVIFCHHYVSHGFFLSLQPRISLFPLFYRSKSFILPTSCKRIVLTRRVPISRYNSVGLYISFSRIKANTKTISCCDCKLLLPGQLMDITRQFGQVIVLTLCFDLHCSD